jgi:tRNA pseudouridine38-40 synthase
MRNIALVIAYDGTNYHGWQCQPNAVTVEETLREKAARILNHSVKLRAAARTDSGVHALGQVANIRTESKIELDGLMRGLNSLLPQDIRVIDGREVAEDFDARYSTRSKVYIYCILNQRFNSPFLARYALHMPYILDPAPMRDALKLVRGEHDFSAFKKKEEVYKSTVRHVLRTAVTRKGRMIYVALEATGFLRYMVRNIVGTLIQVGQGKLTTQDFSEILDSGQSESAGPTAAPHGLFLRRVKYGINL